MRQSETLASCSMKSTQTLLCGASTPYENIMTEIVIQKPNADEPLVAPPRVTIGTFSYVRGQEPLGTNTYDYRPCRWSRSIRRTTHPTYRKPPAPPKRWALPHHPAPPKAPTPPALWVLTTGNVAPYDDFKPKILKEVDDFKGRF